MDLDTEYTFVPLAQQKYIGYHDKRTQELLTKWGIKQNINIQSFSFNEPFQPYLKYHLAESFFKDPLVAKELKTKKFSSWYNDGIVATEVKTEQIPCSVLAMSFFDKLKDPNNNVTYDSNKIRKTMRYNEQGDMITDNLKANVNSHTQNNPARRRTLIYASCVPPVAPPIWDDGSLMILDPECEEYKLYEEDERKEFIFRIMQMLVLGGNLCQYEDVLEPYLDTTKVLYKDLIRVGKLKETNNLSISTMVLEVVAMNSGEPYFPRNIDEKQNFAFLLIDTVSRQITTFIHQLDGHQEWKKL